MIRSFAQGGLVILPAILEPFTAGAPAAVMARLTLDWIIEGTRLDTLLQDVAEEQYQREFALGHFVQVMLDVACGFRPSPRAAFLRRDFQKIASLSAFYRKLGRMETTVTEEVVRQTARRARQLIAAAGALLPEPVPGYAMRILDGNVLAGAEHRIGPLRTTWAAGLPGMSLAVYEPASGLILDLILEENAHSQERALVDRVAVGPGQLWVMDRNFCVRSLLFRIARAESFFLVRWHRSSLPFREVDVPRPAGRCAAGQISEQVIGVEGADGTPHLLRRIVLELDVPTRDGETEIVLITNLPPEVTAEACCAAYAGRWQIEGHYQRLTDLLHCEVPTLGRPRAALFAFSMSAIAGNALAVLQGNLRVAHGEEIAQEVSAFALVDEVAEVYPGMMLAVPPPAWPPPAGCEAAELAEVLNGLADRVPVHRMFRCRRGPKKPRPKRIRGERVRHRSNKKLLDEARAARQNGPPPGSQPDKTIKL
jgi:hypothetical protein